MQFQDIVAEYYTLYRGDNQIPTITDPEWALAANYGNSAIRRWANVDGEEWDELWTDARTEGFSDTYQGTSAFPQITTYLCPDNMQRPGGFIQLTDPVSGAFLHVKVLEQRNIGLESGTAPYAYFTGDMNNGFTLNLNFTGNSNVGWTINWPMYKTPTYFNTTLNSDGSFNVLEDGTTITEVPDASFIINYILAYRFRTSRNFPAYQTAKSDAETALKGMQIKNGTGIALNTWNLNDSNKTGLFGK